MRSFFDNQNLLAIVWKWKLHLLIVGVVTILAAAVFSSPLFIQPLFQSQARVYPTNTNTFSEESESEQMLEMLNSSDLKWQLIDAFDLTSRFDISTAERFYRTKIMEEYNDRISCKKTEYESIEIKALDAEPVVASAMVDSLIHFYNRKILTLHQEKARENAATILKQLKRKRIAIEEVSEKMEPLRKEYGLLDYEIQAAQVTQGYLLALAEGASSRSVADIKELKANLEEQGGGFFLLQKELAGLEAQRDTLANRYDNALIEAEKNSTYTMVIEKPFPADKKAYPIRWLIVLFCLLAVEALALLTIFCVEGIQLSSR
ncbi:Wzz/FepE/Etk N-terminal domain-containing protein [Sunxiuqinia rutila]|uniref:Wzz/FepE/Etk N-terminal domain-containing protein n=1 Tax=Sunxiuqinia rutila TaxID=1397841 RepID=UPI003D365F79